MIARPSFGALILGVAATLFAPALAVASPPGADPSLARRRTPIVEVVERAGPAVVNIASEIEENPFRRRGSADDFFRDFFGPRDQDRSRQSLGSGVIIDPSGLVITNEHVVSRASNVTITLADRRTFEVDVVGADPQFDLAVLKVRGNVRLPAVELGGSSDLMPGETVVAIGNPFGLANSVTTGVVSALHRTIQAEDRVYEGFIQTDAAINPGNSGGALLNIEGKLIGINTAIYSGGTGIGFAIPVDKARAAIDEVLRYGEVRPAFTGVVVDPSSSRGALVKQIHDDSPAQSAGLRVGDRIIDVRGSEVRSGRDFTVIERGMVPGQALRLSVLRGKSDAPTTITLTPRELSFERAAAFGRARLGLQVAPGRGALVIEKVAPNSHAAQVGIRRGDFLLQIGGRRLSSVREFDTMCAAIRDAEAVAVVIGRGNRAYYVTLSLQ
ncbi:trypsin-like peptidase domain-containing protein [Myxococcota bacterium]|nr:trypsin-like peptidase domain-containing protein [Myxococcota bacterium]